MWFCFVSFCDGTDLCCLLQKDLGIQFSVQLWASFKGNDGQSFKNRDKSNDSENEGW